MYSYKSKMIMSNKPNKIELKIKIWLDHHNHKPSNNPFNALNQAITRMI